MKLFAIVRTIEVLGVEGNSVKIQWGHVSHMYQIDPKIMHQSKKSEWMGFLVIR